MLLVPIWGEWMFFPYLARISISKYSDGSLIVYQFSNYSNKFTPGASFPNYLRSCVSEDYSVDHFVEANQSLV